MIVVANRIHVAKGQEEAFENRFKGRAGLVESHKGFVRFELLKPKTVEIHGREMGGSEYYAVLTYWQTPEDFVRWTQSEDFQTAHMHRPPKEMFAGPNVFELHEIIQLAERPTRL